MSGEEKKLPFTVHASRIVYTGRTFKVSEDEVTLPNGSLTYRQTVEHPGAVVVLPIKDDGNIILTYQYRHALKKFLYEVPAGTLEVGEEPIFCAMREIIEEVHFEARTWKSLGTIYPAPGFCNEVQHLFLATNLQPQSARCDEDEIIEVVELSQSSFIDKLNSGEINDGKSIAVFFKARSLGLI